MESWPLLSDTADVETTRGVGVVRKSALCTAHTQACQNFTLGSMLGVPFNFWVLGGGTPVPHLCPRCRGHAERTCVLPRSPTNEARSFILRKPPAKAGSGKGEGRDGQEALRWVLQVQENPFTAGARPPNVGWIRFHQLQSGYIIVG